MPRKKKKKKKEIARTEAQHITVTANFVTLTKQFLVSLGDPPNRAEQAQDSITEEMNHSQIFCTYTNN